jgi:hypothetical protein
MHKRTLLATVLFLIAFLALSWRVSAQNPGPVIERCTPSSGSVNSVLECDGFRLGAEELDPKRVRAIFKKDDVRIPGKVGGSSRVTNDVQTGQQSLDVVVPEEITPGRWQLVIEVGERSSQPVTIEIGEWTPPKLGSVMPQTVSHGEFVWLYGGNLHVNDEIEITDALGHVLRFTSGASGGSTGFTVPRNMPEGKASVRIGLASKNSFSDPLTFVVTSGPIALALWDNQMTKVARGQWTNLVATSLKPLEGADGAEVEFRQGEQVVIQPTLKPGSVHVQVPAALKPGSVELRTRTLRQGLVSEWSKSIVYQIVERPVAPIVNAIEMGDKGAPVFLWEGPDRPTKFDVEPGYELTLRGSFPVGTLNHLLVTFQSSTDQFSLTPTEGEREGLLLKLPGELKTGDWKLSISDIESGIAALIPVIMHVK